LGNGSVALILPGSGPTGSSRGAAGRTGPIEFQRGIEEAGRERRPRKGDLETGSQCGRAKGRFEVSAPNWTMWLAGFGALIRFLANQGGGEQRR
jgi:hypothetical protein